MDYYSNKGGPWANYGTHNGHGGLGWEDIIGSSNRDAPVGSSLLANHRLNVNMTAQQTNMFSHAVWIFHGSLILDRS